MQTGNTAALRTLFRDVSKFSTLPAALRDDREFVLDAMFKKPRVYQYLGPKLQRDPDVVRLLAAGGLPLFDALFPADARSNKRLAIAAVSGNASALKAFSPELRSDRAFMRRAFAENPVTLGLADIALRDDEKFMGPLVVGNPRAYHYLSRRLAAQRRFAREGLLDVLGPPARVPAAAMRDRTLMLDVAKRYGPTLWRMEAPFRSDRAIVLAAVASSGRALLLADGIFRDDPEVVRTAVLNDPEMIHYATWKLLWDPKFIAELVAADPRVGIALRKATPGSNCIEQVEAADPALAQARVALTARLAQLNIDFPNRIHNYAALEEVLKNREGVGADTDPRPVAVVVYPKSDYNNAFNVGHLAELTKAYRLMYYETADEGGFASALSDATKHAPASVLIIGGHGDQTDTLFGSEKPTDDEHLTLDLGDAADLLPLRPLVAAGAKIILKSCDTGRGRQYEQNVANLVADAFPQAELWAPTQHDNNLEQLDRQGLLTGPGFINGKAFAYHVRPRRLASAAVSPP